MPKVRVTLNGTDRNLLAELGLTRNPFPHPEDPLPHPEDIPAWAGDLLRDLAARPIASSKDLEVRLARCSEEFRKLCLAMFVPGRSVSFSVTWERESAR